MPQLYASIYRHGEYKRHAERRRRYNEYFDAGDEHMSGRALALPRGKSRLMGIAATSDAMAR